MQKPLLRPGMGRAGEAGVGGWTAWSIDHEPKVGIQFYDAAKAWGFVQRILFCAKGGVCHKDVLRWFSENQNRIEIGRSDVNQYIEGISL